MTWRSAALAISMTVVCAAGWAADLKASKPDVRKEVAAVIETQLAAFRKGETEKAYALASEPLRAQKPLQVFEQIVQNGYPEVWANQRAEFGIVRDDGKQATVTVRVYSKRGDASYDYTLLKERVGWRVHGVLRHEAKGATL